jgi:hypothetical protein
MKKSVSSLIKFLLRKDNIRDYIVILLCVALVCTEIHAVVIMNKESSQVFTTLVIMAVSFYFKDKMDGKNSDK